MRLAKLFLCTVFFSVGAWCHGQKVALVLSGGGAKGIAHVGVIKALEENNIPIDYIVGTSMGGIVAGAYAAGFSASKIEDIMTSQEFQGWVNGKLEKGYNYFYSKEDPNAAFLSLKLSLDSSFHASITSSLASDLSLNFALAEIFAEASANARNNFDSLFIPARIVSADIFTQQEVVISKGSLGQALRSTLSVPFFYRPIKINGKYLFDGGIYNNFPVDVAMREYDPDVIIGVNVSTKIFNKYPYGKDDELLNSSLLYMLLDKTNPEAIPESGVYVEPNLKGFTAFDFAEARQMIDSGYARTMRQMDEIKAKIGRRVPMDSVNKKRKVFHQQNPPLRFTGIRFHGFNSKQRKYINKIFKFKQNKSLDMDEIKSGYFRLVSEKFFRTIYPDITYDQNSQSYQLDIYGRPRNNFNIEVGGAIASRNISQMFLGLEYYYFDNYLLKNSLNFYTGSLYKSAQIKSRLNLATTNQFYIEPEVTFNNWDYIDADDILVSDSEPTLLISTDRKYGLNLGIPVGSQFKGVLHSAWINNTDRFANTPSFTAMDTLDRLDISGIRIGASVSRNNLNNKQYAYQGKAFSIDLDYFSIEERYRPGSTSPIETPQKRTHQWLRVKATLEQYFRMGNYSTGYFFEGVASNQPFFSNYYATIANAPAFNPLQDSRTLFLEKFRAHDYLAVGLRNVLILRPNLDLRLDGYAFKALASISETESQQPEYNDVTDDVYIAATAAATLHSPIGPINFSVNYYDDTETKLGVLLHVGFLLFQEKSMD